MRLFFLTILTFGSCMAAVPKTLGQLPVYFRQAGDAPGAYRAQGLHYGIDIEARKAKLTLGASGKRLDVSVDYVNSNPRAALEARDPLATRASEFIGNDRSRWRTNLPTYGKVAARNLYPGIDLVYYGNDRSLEYDFVISPAADPRQIRMRFSGGARLSIGEAGDLMIHTASGDLVQHRPVVYQQDAGGAKHEIAGRFVLINGNEAGFQVAKYDHARTLTVDPQISFSSFVGDYSVDEGLAVAVDNGGNVYVAGYTTSNSYGDADLLILALNPAGTAANYIVQAGGSFGFGGSNDDVVNGIGVDGYGSLVAVGSTSSADFPTTIGSFQQAGAGGTYDAFILRLDPTGQNLIYSTFFGGTGDDEIWRVAVDALGNAYCVGDTTSTDLPATTGAYKQTNSGGVDGFIGKFDASGNQLWTTYFGGSSDENAYAIAIDPAGNSYVTGFTDSSNFPVLNAYKGSFGGGDDAFVLKMNPSGTQIVYSTFLGGSGNEQGTGIALDGGLNAYISGTTSSTNFPVTQSAYKNAYQGGNSDIFVSKLSPDGASLVYSTYMGSHGTDEAWGIAVDGQGNAYITGDTDSDQYIVSGDAQQKSRGGGTDAVLTVFNPAGSGLIYSTFIGGRANDSGEAIAIDSSGAIYITGYTSSSNFPITSGVVETTPGGQADAFIVKYSFPVILPLVSANGVVNTAGFAPGAVSPGSIISIFGSNFDMAPVIAQTVPLPVSLGSVGVKINGIAAPLYYVGPTQINAQVPFEVPPGPASVVVTGLAGPSASASFTVAAAAPGIFTSGTQAVVQNQDGSVNSASNPAKGGTIVTVYLTGIGPLDNAVATGAAASSAPVSKATMPVSVTINGTPAISQFTGMTPGSVGLAQANVVTPAGLTGNYPLVIAVGSVRSNSATISVAP